MKQFYSYSIDQLKASTGARIAVVESDVDLYYHMALSMYYLIERNNALGRATTCILPVGPVFQYRRFITLLQHKPLDLSRVHFFFMDEYLVDQSDDAIAVENPLSFRGFIIRELIQPMPEEMGLNIDQLHFPNPHDPQAYDRLIEDLGGLQLCHAGIGIVGHLAFNEPQPANTISVEDFKQLPTRILELTPQTITINSHTALQGAYEEIPKRAVTVGMKQILGAETLRLYCNRPWQASVLRKALMLSPTPEFPVTCAQGHPDVTFTITPVVAACPEFALK